MDQVKTGTLIAKKRKELGMTQKELADRLCISDRTVSKWERSAGFPDISLIEPLADALNLSVLELLHGEEEKTDPQLENSARETLQALEPQVRQIKNRFRRWALLLTALAILICTVIPLLCRNAEGRWISSYEISSAEAASISPMILITRQDHKLIEALLKNSKVQAVFDDDSLTTIELDASEISHYLRLIEMDHAEPEWLIVQTHQNDISVFYGTDHIWVSLSYQYGDMDKSVVICEYPYRENGAVLEIGRRHGNRTDLSNDNNTRFYRSGYQTGWLELFRTTYY